MSARLLDDLRTRLGRRVDLRRQQFRQQPAALLRIERRDRQLVPVAGKSAVGDHLVQVRQCRVRHQIFIAIAEEQQQRRLLRRRTQFGEERAAVAVSPLQIVDPDDHRMAVAQALEDLA